VFRLLNLLCLGNPCFDRALLSVAEGLSTNGYNIINSKISFSLREKGRDEGISNSFFPILFPLTQTLSLRRGLFAAHKKCVHRLAQWERVFLELPFSETGLLP
jgi:hypothetical protein